MNPLSAAITIKALDGLTLRQAVLAENIANAGTANYRPRAVSFETALAAAAQEGLAAVKNLNPTITTNPQTAGSSGPRTDLDLATGAATETRYAALIEVLSRQMQIDDLALSDKS